jgi:hypothetical protein
MLSLGVFGVFGVWRFGGDQSTFCRPRVRRDRRCESSWNRICPWRALGLIVHPLVFVDYFRENAAENFDHLVHRLAGRLFKIFADVHGANGIAKTVNEK